MEPLGQSTDNKLMNLPGQWRLIAASLCALSVAGPCIAQAIARQDQIKFNGSGLSSFRRLLRHFDFEEAQNAPYEMPINFYRHIEPGKGFPAFGKMKLTNEIAAGGNWSFGFKLDGGSLSAKIPTAVIPVLPGSDYMITAKVRTKGLNHARARISAWFNDETGKIIEDSRINSSLERTGGSWQDISILLFGDFNKAADLVLDLQLLQPNQFIGSKRIHGEPLLEDMAGQAWFDEITIWHQPRIELSTSAPGNVVTVSAEPKFNVLVRDLTGEDLSGKLRILDLNSNTMLDEVFEIERGTTRRIIDLSRLQCGWYRAVLDIREGNGNIDRRLLDFVVMPDDLLGSRAHENSFGVILPPTPVEHIDTVVHLLRQLGVARVIMSLDKFDTRSGIGGAKAAPPQAVRRAAKILLADAIELTFLLDEMQSQFSNNNLSANDQELGESDSLDSMLVNFGAFSQRWQIGNAAAFEVINPRNLNALIGNMDRSLKNFVPGPVVSIPWPVEREPPPIPSPHGFSILLPYNIQAESLEEFAPAWLFDATILSVTYQSLPPELYSPRDRIIDLVLRTLYGWRAGIKQPTIQAPWYMRGRGRAQLVPDIAYGPWHILANQLGRRSYAGDLPLGEGLRGWLIKGARPGDTVLAAWNEQTTTEKSVIKMLLADGPVVVKDVFGNTKMVYVEDGYHTIKLDNLPVFIEGVDINLAKFRAGFEFTPSFIPARRQEHEHEIKLSNPWDVPISVDIRLIAPENWRISPRRHRVTIQPGEVISQPVTLTFDPGVVAERTFVEAQIELVADRDYKLNIHVELEVGLEEARMSAHWQAVYNPDTGTYDLHITQYVTNTGNQPISLDGYISAPQMPRQRRNIATLAPNRTSVKVFRIKDGARLLAGKEIRVGVIERGGNARLNQILYIPPFIELEEGNDLISSGSK